MFDARTNLSAEVRTEVRRHMGPAVYDTQIPRSVRLSEAPSHGLPDRPVRSGIEGRPGLQRVLARVPGATTGRASRRDPEH